MVAAGLPLSEVVVYDDGSSDGTQDVVRQAGLQHRYPVILESVGMRRGKSVVVAQAMRDANARSPILVFCDADVRIDVVGVRALLARVAETDSPTLVWGTCRPITYRWDRRPSAVQMEIAYYVACVLPFDSPRANGRFYAVTRRAALDVFQKMDTRYAQEDQVIAVLAWGEGLSQCSVPEAVCYALPARGIREFVRQTARSYRNLGSIGHLPSERNKRARLYGVWQVARRDPLGLGFYLVVRLLVPLLKKLVQDGDGSATFEASPSTKELF